MQSRLWTICQLFKILKWSLIVGLHTANMSCRGSITLIAFWAIFAWIFDRTVPGAWCSWTAVGVHHTILLLLFLLYDTLCHFIWKSHAIFFLLNFENQKCKRFLSTTRSTQVSHASASLLLSTKVLDIRVIFANVFHSSLAIAFAHINLYLRRPLSSGKW